MQDELRAAWLAAALDGDEPPEAIDDEELAALASLGAELRRAGPDLAAISRAETTFRPAFAHTLGAELRAAHPAGARPEARPAPRPLWVRGGRLLRSLIALGVLALAVVAILVVTLVRGFQPSVQTGSATSPTAPPAASSAARPHAFQALTAHPPAVASAPHGKNAPATPAPSTAPRSASGAGARTNGGIAPVAPRIQAQAGGPLTYRLPAPLPRLPARLPIYRVRAVPVSAAGALRIAARFPGLQATAAPAGSRLFSGSGSRLEVVLATGEVRYTATPPGRSAPSRARTQGAAIAAARAWLRGHGIYPAGVDEAATTVSSQGPLTRVTFAPHTALPQTASAAISVRVDLDLAGHVLAARRFWPSLEVSSIAGVRSPAVAVATRRARQASPSDHAASTRPTPPTPVFRVEQVVPGYALSAHGARLLPVYVLSGVVTTADGASTPMTQVLPATDH